MPANPLTEKSLKNNSIKLAKKVPQFQQIANLFGIPPLWDRQKGFSTLIYIILEQQVSLASAKATFDKLNSTLKEFTPRSFLKLNDEQLKEVGFSRQKIRYCRIVAKEILNGNLDLEKFNSMDDISVKEKLMSIIGIGNWTSDIYLLMVLLRPDVWPHGDRALAVAVYEVFKMSSIPSYEELSKIAEGWEPYRSVAARFLWHHYLNTKRGKNKK